ncbi:MAG: DUF455 family protein [Planctomycetes bacterium]|nr:DUF455 family protein [Planctomycetota bacterium]MCB9871068.1 DUF455 family protein [Planctomycetota bacterium]
MQIAALFPEDTVEHWAACFVRSTDLAVKTSPPPPPGRWADPARPHRLAAPGRPAALRPIERTTRSHRAAQLQNPKRRAQLLHTFWHHELQAAELMCWALLAFPDTPRAFRRGLLAICHQELRHMALYQQRIEALEFQLGDFPVRDWFWERVASTTSPLHFVALLGLGFEGGNLDHAARFTAAFAAAGDPEAAAIQQRVGDEEVGHVRFALRWFRRFGGALEFDAWRHLLVEPLTPAMMRGAALDTGRRRAAGFPEEFLAALDAFGVDRP